LRVGSIPLDTNSRQDFAVVSHGHSDHIAPHRRALMTPETAAFYRHRHLEAGPVIELPFGASYWHEGLEIRLYSAGHILGSAMVWISDGTTSVLYTGDMKLRGSLTCPPAECVHADVLITETTFGLPNYRFPTPEALREQIVGFARETIAMGGTPVFLGYPLGKGQELTAILCHGEIPVAVQQSIGSLMRAYERFGVVFPGAEIIEGVPAAGTALVLTPGSDNARLLAAVPAPRIAYCSGWAQLEKPFWGGASDIRIALSDHADFPELLELVDRVQPKQVLTVHGYTHEMASIYRRYGIPAIPLSELGS
jgi:Cft2 family RNA processing exonuclease